ncbi:hypothetical protein EIQ27_17340 [Xanthomonas campestris pv. armoraciae]|nr:hypothetical protein D0A41_11310 [Xanthomonas campestris]RFF59468.1 hypothetical protein D0A36_09240 [Xanthomonas campestris]RFF71107.1 hypothetical protein D0A39_12820 [Xanthomonas campestris pv. campestris]
MLCTSTISTGPCPHSTAGNDAAWMPRKSRRGRPRGVSCDGGRARVLAATPQIRALQAKPQISRPATKAQIARSPRGRAAVLSVPAGPRACSAAVAQAAVAIAVAEIDHQPDQGP